ncbi:MAG: hypothetical protein JOZ81_05755 [Chloroflexi bacterium]|nr:hypothetical protein [Chloroflexota bacterium]
MSAIALKPETVGEWSTHDDVSVYPRLYSYELTTRAEELKLADHQLLVAIGRLLQPQVPHFHGLQRQDIEVQRKPLSSVPEEQLWDVVNANAWEHQRSGWVLDPDGKDQDEISPVDRINRHFMPRHEAYVAFRQQQAEEQTQRAEMNAAARVADLEAARKAPEGFSGFGL